MTKKFLSISLMFVLFGGIVAVVILFLFPHGAKQPSKVVDSVSTPQGVQEVVNANNQFAFDLYSELDKSEQGNIFYSPYSISAALAMTYEGAKGQTADEMKSVFHFPEKNILRPNFAKIYSDINKENKNYELKTSNALWVQKNHPLLKDYTNRVEKYYGGKATNLDFERETEKSRQTINSFVEKQTNNKIKNLIPQGVINLYTRLVLTDAIYFKGIWKWEFNKSDTNNEQPFMITPSNIVETPMMYMYPDTANFNYADTDGLQILELPYKGGKISMLILLPTKNLSTLESSLTLKMLKKWEGQMSETNLDTIGLPKFKLNTKYFMGKTLSAMGMPTAFSDRKADFSGMTTAEHLYISEVIHQAYIKVDEKGTEAAAATAVVMEVASSALHSQRNTFIADHPFIFIIQEKDTGNILFLGRVVNPTKQ